VTVADPSAVTARARALVVDDEWTARSYLVELIEASGIGTVVAAVGTAAQALEVLQSSQEGVEVDVVFIDVQLGTDAVAGLSLARAVAALQGGPTVVLATAYGQHALDAYEIGVADYLRKPFTAERVARCLLRVSAQRPAPKHRLRRVIARKGRSLVFLRLDDVWAFEAAGRLVRVHASRGIFDMDLSLAAIETQLAGHVIRVHRNWLVHIERVLELSRDGSDTTLAVGVDGPGALAPLMVPVTRERAAEVRAALLARIAQG
jgi:DNA-binding LytR/AlgR family response regulator